MSVAVQSGQQGWIWALLAAAVGAGALARYPLGTADEGLLFVALYAVGLVVLAFPLLLAEAALGQLRGASPVGPFGSGPWRWAGAFNALVALALAALVALLGGWAARYAIASFQGDFFDDPARFFRVASQGWDALLFALAILTLAFGVGQMGRRTGPRPLLVAVGVVAVLAAVAIAAWGLLQGSGARAAAFDLPWRSLDAAFVVAALQQSLLPGLVGFGAVAAWSAGASDRRLAQRGGKLLLLWVAVPLALGIGLAAFAHESSAALGNGLTDPFTSIAALFGAIAGTQGGILAGTLFGLLAFGSIAASVALLDVPATWLQGRSESWTTWRAHAAAALVAYLLVAPLAFLANLPQDVHAVLLGVVAPLGGLLLAVHVGWVRPQALANFTYGEAGHRLDNLLRPVLRYVLPLPLLALLVLGFMGVLAETGAATHGSGGLWRLVP